ncbi:MAG: hypothetical protein OER98_11930 [Gammaproteobacteria bacterium]|nr:hypothetical protein [Gammaproteobacteria bacterium]
MRALNMSKISTVTLLLMIAFWGPSLSYAQQTAEQFIPIGMSPGISNKHSYIGSITVVNRQTNSFVMKTSTGEKEITITQSTRMWLDRSKKKKTNIEASIDDCEAGRTVEVMHSRENENIADWVKIEPS